MLRFLQSTLAHVLAICVCLALLVVGCDCDRPAYYARNWKKVSEEKPNKVPDAVIGRMAIEDMQIADHGFAYTSVVVIDKSRIGWIDVKAYIDKKWDKDKQRRNESYLEIFKSDDGWYVVAHGEYAWELQKVESNKDRSYQTIKKFHKAKKFSPLLADDLPDDLKRAHERHTFENLESAPPDINLVQQH